MVPCSTPGRPATKEAECLPPSTPCSPPASTPMRRTAATAMWRQCLDMQHEMTYSCLAQRDGTSRWRWIHHRHMPALHRGVCQSSPRTTSPRIRQGFKRPPRINTYVLARLLTHDSLEIAHNQRERVWADCRANAVVGGLNVGDPITHGFVDGILQGPRAGLDSHYLLTTAVGTQHNNTITNTTLAKQDERQVVQAQHVETRWQQPTSAPRTFMRKTLRD